MVTQLTLVTTVHGMHLCLMKRLVTLTGLPTTQSSVNDGRTSSFSSSEMSYEKKRNMIILIIELFYS